MKFSIINSICPLRLRLLSPAMAFNCSCTEVFNLKVILVVILKTPPLKLIIACFLVSTIFPRGGILTFKRHYAIVILMTL